MRPPPVPSAAIFAASVADVVPKRHVYLHGRAAPRGVVIGVDLAGPRAIVSIVQSGIATRVPDDLAVSDAALRPRSIPPLAHGPRIVLNSERPPPPSVAPPRLHGLRPSGPGDVASLLANARSRAEAHTGRPVDGAILAVPASFGEGEREAVRGAAQEAGILAVRLVTRPTAAARSLAATGAIVERVVVVDCSPGVFEISVVRTFGGTARVVATGSVAHGVSDAGDEARLDMNELGRLSAALEEVCAAAGLARDRSMAIVVVGAQSIGPSRARLERLLVRRAATIVASDDAVAGGAAHLGVELGDAELSDVLPASIGFAGRGEGFLRLVAKGTKLPTRRSFLVQVPAEQRGDYRLPLYQGENVQARANEYLGDLVIPRGAHVTGARSYDLTFVVDEQCVMGAEAVDMRTGEPVDVQIQWSAPDDGAPEDVEWPDSTRRVVRNASTQRTNARGGILERLFGR